MAETGHAKNVANFESMVSLVTGYGADYKPGNAAISLANLTAALASAQAIEIAYFVIFTAPEPSALAM